MSIPCLWQGDLATSTPPGGAPLHYCRLHAGDLCTIADPANGRRCCGSCPDHATRTVPSFGGKEPVRNLLYHVYPRKGNDVWRWNVAQLLARIGQFNGRRIVGLATGLDCDPADVVRQAFAGQVREFVVRPNDPTLREVATFAPMLELLFAAPWAANPEQITWVGHAKGVTYFGDRIGTVPHWTQVGYETCLDHPGLVADQLERFPCTGPFKKVGKCWVDSSATWNYSGSFYWLRNCEVLARDWRRIDRTCAGLETYPGIHFRAEEAGCLFHESPEADMCLYDPACWARVAEAYATWKAERAAATVPARGVGSLAHAIGAELARRRQLSERTA